MSENNIRRTRLLEDLDNVRKKISELEESEHKHTEERARLKDDLEQLRIAVDNAQLGVFVLDVQGKVRYLNALAQKKLAFPAQDKTADVEITSMPQFKETELAAQLKHCLEAQKQSVFDVSIPQGDAAEAWIRLFLHPLLNKDGSINGAFGVVEDITAFKNQETDLKLKLGLEKSSHKILSGLVGVMDIDEAINKTLANLGELSKVSRTFLFLLYENDTKMDNTHEWCASGVNPLMDQLQNIPVNNFPWWMKKLNEGDKIAVSEPDELPEAAAAEKEFMQKQGIISLLLIPIHIKEKLAGFLGYSSITEAKKWKDKDIRLLETIEKILGGFLERKRIDDGKKERDERFRRFAQASFEGLFVLFQDKVTDTNHVAGAMLGYKPSEFLGKALTEFIADKEKAQFRKNFQKGTVKPFDTLAKKKDGSELAVELQARMVPIQEQSYLFVSMRDVSERSQVQADNMQSLGKLKQAFDGTLQAMAATVASRDPFAVGHAAGVARLACAIAEKMGLTQDQVEGIRYAALVHDIGKISIPLEILSKPGKITAAERMIVQEHPQAAYDVLKDVEFPWPVAETVLQHHERMNGAGYPKGLPGDKIILEARILAVADRVVAVLSRRSYRAAGTIKDAAAEISKHKGVLYDPEVAEAVLSILKTDGFKLES